MSFNDTDLIEQIYTAGLVPELWPDVIHTLSSRLQARGGSLFVLSEGRLAWDAPPATKAIMEDYIAGGWDKKNPRLNGLLSRAHPGFIQDRDVAEGDYDELPIVRDFLRPRDIAHTAATVIKGARDDLAVFSVDRGMAAGAFSVSDIAWLDAIRPHLGRSIALTSRLKMQQAASATATLQLVGVPAAVIGSSQTVIATNALFEALVGPVFLASAYGRLALKDRRADRALQQALAVSTAAAPVVRSIPVTSSSNAVGVLHAIPASRQSNDILGAGGVLIVLAQVKENASVEAEWLKWLYDFSPKEAQVAAYLTGGLDIEAIAEKNAISVSTVRSHVKQVLRKTGFTRQTDFVRSVSSLSTLKPTVFAAG